MYKFSYTCEEIDFHFKKYESVLHMENIQIIHDNQLLSDNKKLNQELKNLYDECVFINKMWKYEFTLKDINESSKKRKFCYVAPSNYGICESCQKNLKICNKLISPNEYSIKANSHINTELRYNVLPPKIAYDNDLLNLDNVLNELSNDLSNDLSDYTSESNHAVENATIKKNNLRSNNLLSI
jgi:hypothetical protein